MPDISRERALRLNQLLDDWVPPRLRDSRPFAWLARRLYHGTAIDIVDFKSEAFHLGADAYGAFYAQLDERFPGGETDLTRASLDAVVAAVVGDRVLDVACGDGLLVARLGAEHATVVGCDVFLSPSARARGARLVLGNIERLPFPDGAFDTVVSTHTLEHVQHLPATLAELRRVARTRLVVVVPRQRPYRVTFNPHIHFFPYDFSLLAFTGTDRPHRLDLVGGDWLYVEDRDS
jgi:ubiquinone/menaquinone biosynthesis C-methylase UbiE